MARVVPKALVSSVHHVAALGEDLAQQRGRGRAGQGPGQQAGHLSLLKETETGSPMETEVGQDPVVCWAKRGQVGPCTSRPHQWAKG